MEFQVVTGHRLKKYINTIASLRMAVFREYPYLYDGSMDSEEAYLKSYASSKNSILVMARDKEETVGVVAGMPLIEMDEVFQSPFEKHNVAIHSIFYLGDMLLLKEYRGRGIGSKIYKMFEDLVRKNKQYQTIAIAEILRDKNDPRQPKNYVSADKFWASLHYAKHPEIVIQIPYKEVDSAGKVPHLLVVSCKDLEERMFLAE